MSSLIAQAADKSRLWLTRDALPFWGGAGLDRDGLFHERTDLAGRPDVACPRRMRVQARQVYVFSEAAVRGWWPGARAAADAGFAALLAYYWAPDDKLGFIHLLGPDKATLDPKRDAYDHAFGLFASAWYYKASADPLALSFAHDVLDLMDTLFSDPIYGGYIESQPPTLPRRSDPHMHLLEAMLEWYSATGEPRFLDVAKQMTALCEARFFDPSTGTLREYFSADLGPAHGPDGRVVAPGHHFEWSWLLAWARSLGAGDARNQADALYDFGINYGRDARGFAIDECDPQGRQVRKSRRAWPQTELIKAYVNKAREGVQGAADAAARLTLDVFDSYLATDVPGLWMDQFDGEGRAMSESVPASTLYHLVVAFRELMLFAKVQQMDGTSASAVGP